MATIIDVAKMAGVSQGTASNVLNGKGNVSSEKTAQWRRLQESSAIQSMKGQRSCGKEAGTSSV